MTKAEIITLCCGKLGISDATAQAQAGLFLDARHSMLWNEHDWRQCRYQESIAVPAGTQDVTVGATCEIIRGARWAGAQELLPTNDAAMLALNPAGYDTSGPVLAFIPLGKNSAGQVVLRLVQKPTEAKTLLVFGKKKVCALGTNDTPAIPGEDQALCEFVLADLYEWLRQFAKAQHFMQKGMALLERMRAIEVEQSGEIRRIVPYVQEVGGGGGDSFNPLG
jgi:hypothetical protein